MTTLLTLLSLLVSQPEPNAVFPTAETAVGGSVPIHFNDDIAVSFGNTSAAPDCWWEWDTDGTDALDLICTDIDGIGTDGTVCYVNTGTDDWACNGSVVIANAAGVLSFTGATSATVSTGTANLTLMPATGKIKLTKDGGANHGVTLDVTTTNDTLVLRNAADGAAGGLSAGAIATSGNVYTTAPRGMFYGGSTNNLTFIPRNEDQTPDTGMLTTGPNANSLLICEYADIGIDFAQTTAYTNPTLRIQSADATAPTGYMALSHNQRSASLLSGKGGLEVSANSAGTDVDPSETVISSPAPFRGIAAANNDGGDVHISPASGANDLTGVTKAGTGGDTVTFYYHLIDGTSGSVVLTEAVDYACVLAADDATCVANLITAQEANATLGPLVGAVTRVGETTAFYPEGNAVWLKVVPSDGTNTVISRGTDGVTYLDSPYVYMGTRAQGMKFDTTTDGDLTITDESAGGIDLKTGVNGRLYAEGTSLSRVALAFAYSHSTISTNGGDTLSAYTGSYSGTVASGALSLYTGAQSNAGDYASGKVSVYTGATTTDGNTGLVEIYTGAAGAGAADAGNITLATNGAPGVGTTGLQILGATGKVDVLAVTQGDLGATCTLGQIAIDTGGATKELCLCQATDTWYCAAITDTTGPAD